MTTHPPWNQEYNHSYCCRSFINGIYVIAEAVFIDGSDELAEGQWIYSNNAPITYLQWGGSEPSAIVLENCLILASVYGYNYNDANCVTQFATSIAFCERPQIC